MIPCIIQRHSTLQALKPTPAEHWYLLDKPFPSLALVRVAQLTDDFRCVAEGIMRIISHLCDNCIPHNVFCTLAGGELRVIIYPRDREALSRPKELSGFNIACFELGGYVPVGSKYNIDSSMPWMRLL